MNNDSGLQVEPAKELESCKTRGLNYCCLDCRKELCRFMSKIRQEGAVNYSDDRSIDRSHDGIAIGFLLCSMDASYSCTYARLWMGRNFHTIVEDDLVRDERKLSTQYRTRKERGWVYGDCGITSRVTFFFSSSSWRVQLISVPDDDTLLSRLERGCCAAATALRRRGVNSFRRAE